MTATLLAVDDSKTMRKVIEITFAGENYRMVLAESPADAMAKLRAEKPSVALVDALLGGANGYDLCQQIKAEAPQVGVIVLSSKQHPYDRVKGGAVGADDYIDKPYDTQALIDKVAAVIQKVANAPARPAAAPVAAARPAAAAASASTAQQPAAAQASSSQQTGPARTTMSFGAPARQAAAPVATAPTASASASRPQPAPAAPVAAQPTTAAAARPAPVQPAAHAAAAPAAPAPAAAAAPATAQVTALVGASMESKLGALGLTKDQIAGVLALSRDVVEQVVWEVVPVLAETMIREEIRRLTAE